MRSLGILVLLFAVGCATAPNLEIRNIALEDEHRYSDQLSSGKISPAEYVQLVSELFIGIEMSKDSDRIIRAVGQQPQYEEEYEFEESIILARLASVIAQYGVFTEVKK